MTSCPHCGRAGVGGGLAAHIQRAHPEAYMEDLRSLHGTADQLPDLVHDLDLRAALDRWSRARAAAPSTIRGYASVLRALELAGMRRLSDLTPGRVSAYLAHRLQTLSASAARVHWAAVCSILAELERADLFPLEHLVRIRRLRPRRPRRARLCARFLSRSEFERLRQGARETSRPRIELAIMVGALAGLRAAELARLRWGDLDLTARTIAVRNCPELGEHGRIKTGQERLVPMCQELRDALAPRQAQADGFVFATLHRGAFVRLPFAQVRVLRRELAAATRISGLSGITWHVLRHTRASWWIQAGVPAAKIVKWLGHSLYVLEAHYAGLAEGYDPDAERAPAA